MTLDPINCQLNQQSNFSIYEVNQQKYIQNEYCLTQPEPKPNLNLYQAYCVIAQISPRLNSISNSSWNSIWNSTWNSTWNSIWNSA